MIEVKGKVEFGVDTLNERIDPRVPTEAYTVEVVTDLLSPFYVEHSCLHYEIILSLECIR